MPGKHLLNYLPAACCGKGPWHQSITSTERMLLFDWPTFDALKPENFCLQLFCFFFFYVLTRLCDE